MNTYIPLRFFLVVFFSVVVVSLATIGWKLRTSTHEAASPDDRIVATIENRQITLREIEKTAALPLYLLEQQRHQLLQQALQKLIDERLLEGEASRQGISVSQLLDEASQSESIARLANLPAPVKRLHGGESSQDPQEQARIRQALIVSLRRKANIAIDLPTVEPPVLPVDTQDDRRLGPDQAPVTIVEFSDFQCPYCQQSVQILKELRQLYGGRIRLIYRDYPGPNHPYAPQAAEAARCAGVQGKFWEYHDLLFDRQSSGKGWDFLSLARELGLQQNLFEGCLHSGRFRAEITKDLQEGLKLGITSTPTFFVNGRPLVGAQSMANFQAIIDRLLAQQPLS